MPSLRSDPTKGFNPILVNCLTYFGAAAVFFVGSNIMGLPVIKHPSYLAWLPPDMCNPREVLNFVTMGCWGEHFVRRFTEVLLVHVYRRKMSIVESLGAPAYYWIFGFFIGWSVNYKIGYQSPHLGFYCAGAALFIIGEIGNCVCHIMLKNLRNPANHLQRGSADGVLPTPPTNRHVIPHRFLFELVSCPHYFCEVVTWFGFFLMTFTLPVALFLVATVITLISLSLDKHKSYKTEFNGQNGKELYPPKRKALIPFLL